MNRAAFAIESIFSKVAHGLAALRSAPTGAAFLPGTRLLFVDGLRGIAAAAVMLYHFEGRVELPLLSFLEIGYVGVAIFFTLSGFVIAMTTDQPLSFGFLGRFALRRSIRLDVPYWVNIAMITLLAVFGARYGVNMAVPSFDQILAHVFYAQDFLGLDPISIVYWSLCFEIQFYLFLVLLVMGLKRGFGRLDHPASLLVFAVFFGLSLCERTGLLDAPRGLALVFWFNFSLGAACYWALAGRVSRWFFLLLVAATLLEAVSMDDKYAYGASLTALAIYIAGVVARMNVWLAAKPFQFLGQISYSLYLLHGVFGWYALSIAQLYVHDAIAFAIGIAASISSAWIGYLLIEKPSIKLSRQVKMRKQAAPTIAAPAEVSSAT